MNNIIERCRSLSSAMVSDVLRRMQLPYLLDPGIRAVAPEMRAAGPAFTVWAEAGSIITVHKAVLEAPPGTVLVVGGETGKITNMALFGKLMATQSQLNGIAAVIIDGAVRDSTELGELGFPVFARAVTPHVGLNRTLGQTGVPVPFGGLTVHPGDIILGDADGLAVIPQDRAEEVIARVEELAAREQEYLRQMAAGRQLADLIGLGELFRSK